MLASALRSAPLLICLAPVRGVLGLLNAASLMTYAIGVRKAFGATAGWWYLAMQASQFHVIYYASRTLPNMFAFGIGAYRPPNCPGAFDLRALSLQALWHFAFYCQINQALKVG